MTDAPPAPRRILAVLGGGADAITLASAAALADRHGAAIDVFCCVEPPHDISIVSELAGRTPALLLDDLCAQRLSEAEALVAAHLPDRAVAVHLRTGKTFVEVIRHVIASNTDFVIKAAEPLTGVHRYLFASTDQHLLRKCPCPVWLVTTGARPIPRHVLAAVDVDEWDAAEPETLLSLNRRVIGVARQVAALSGARLTVLHAWEAVGDGLVWAFSSSGDPRAKAESYVNHVYTMRERALDRLLADAGASASDDDGVVLRPRLVRGLPEQVIEAQSRELGADVVVMGTVARTGLSGIFIGNTAENIINSLECPVLAVKPRGFVSPLAED